MHFSVEPHILHHKKIPARPHHKEISSKLHHKEIPYRPYSILNLVFIVIILLVLLYSGIFSSDKANYPVKSAYTVMTGNESISSGLSSSFSEIMRLNFKRAHDYNPYGIRIFLFFLVQLFFRINFFIIAKKSSQIPALIIMDIALSLGVFLITFWPFLVNAVKVIPDLFSSA